VPRASRCRAVSCVRVDHVSAPPGESGYVRGGRRCFART
jgi:hypothetical protein